MDTKTERDPMEVWISASQVETRKLCNRKWHFNSVLKLPRPESASTALGTILHKAYEDITQGKDPFADPAWNGGFSKHEREAKSTLVRQIIENAMQQGAVAFEPKALCEHKFEIRYLRPSGYTIVLNGSIDAITVSPISAVITDYKNLKNLRYAKDDDTVKEALQMRTYAIVAMHENPNLSTVVMEHKTLCTDPKTPGKYKYASNIATASEIRQWEADFLAKGDEMIAERISNTIPPGVPNEEGGCEAFGGCEFASICSGRNTIAEYTAINTPKTQTATQKGNTDMSSLFAWKKTAAAQAEAAQAEAEQVVQTPEAANAKLAMPAHAIDPVAALLADAPAAAPVAAIVESLTDTLSMGAEINEATEAAPKAESFLNPGDRVTDGKRYGTYTGDSWVRWDGNTKRSKVDDLNTLKYTPGEAPKSEVVSQWVEGEVASDVSASKGSDEPVPVLESEAAEVHPVRAPNPRPCMPIITLYVGCVPSVPYMTTNQLLNDKRLVGENYWAKNAFTRRDELMFMADVDVRSFLEDEGFEHIVHVEDAPDAKTVMSLVERVADIVVRSVK